VNDLRSRLEFAVRIAREAGDHTLRYYRRPDLEIESKADSSPVTQADREAEALLVLRIRAAYPADGILGEESGEVPSRNGYRWILDPIDGTRSFARGVPLFGTLIGMEMNGEVLAGVIHMPACGETVYAAKGDGAWWQVENEAPRPARVSAVRSLAQAHFICTSPEGFRKRGLESSLEQLMARSGATRTWGDCYAYALVATGRAECVVDPVMAAWDAAALIPILQEAGGAFTDWNGDVRFDGGNGIGSNGWLHEEILSILDSR
jgi:histidinol-phosphatase